MKMTKKGSLNLLVPMVLLLVVAVIATSLCAGVVSNIRDSQTSAGYAYNVSTQGLTGLSNLSSQFGSIGLVIGIIVIIGLLIMIFRNFGGRQ